MCEDCIRMAAQVPPEIVTAFESLLKDAEELGNKAFKTLSESGYLTLLPDTYSEEEKAAGLLERAMTNYGLAALAGYACNNNHHDPETAAGCDALFDTTGRIGWSVGFVNQTATKN